MKNRLIAKYLTAFALLAVASFIFIETLGASLIYNHILDDTSRRLYSEVNTIVEDKTMTRIMNEDSLNQAMVVLRALASAEDARILYSSEDGTVRLDTAEETVSKSGRLDHFDPVALGENYYTVGKYFNYFDEDMLTVMMPVSDNLQISGYLSIHVPISRLISQQESYLRVILLILGIIVLLILVVFVFITVSFQKPLNQIVAGAKEFAAGNLNHKIEVKSRDELGELSSTLNFMASDLAKTGESQRNFISNVSHDFRSPLTSIKGYVEAILDGTVPPEMQEHYLGIVLNETKRLEKLTRGILTLNDINGKGTVLDITSFDLNGVIKETAESFEGTCVKRHISIDLLLTGTELKVSADYGKIQQVLYNLLDNAIKFSRDNSSIEIETSVRKEKAYVAVRDHGTGIPSKNLNKIWDRFYKVDSSRGRDTKGNGIGLAIVRDIIDAHNQTITVVSTEGAGSEFIFSLELAPENH
ncbi:MAG: sensor histidine kinase [Bilifractor sp.]|jgi:signal transduction histidine kinase